MSIMEGSSIWQSKEPPHGTLSNERENGEEVTCDKGMSFRTYSGDYFFIQAQLPTISPYYQFTNFSNGLTY